MATESASPSAPAAAAPKKKSKSMLLVVVLMAVEGAAIFFVTKTFFGSAPATVEAGATEGGGAEAAHGEAAPGGGGHGEAADGKGEPGHGGAAVSEFTELELSECRPANRVSGKLILFRMRVSALVRSSNADKTKGLIEANKARINDRVNFVIRSADPGHLSEPSLDTIKRRIKSEVDRVVGDETLIHEILIPEMLPSGTGL